MSAVLTELLILVALRKESVDRNTKKSVGYSAIRLSLSARRAWIEILGRYFMAHSRLVALRKESVDRNIIYLLTASVFLMSLSARRAWIEIGRALRQLQSALRSLSARRAWIEIGAKADSVSKWTASLSARRAWIEMRVRSHSQCLYWVALRKESVDRNTSFCPVCLCDLPSLSARRAWIEMIIAYDNGNAVAGRSPQGERG